jgi:hypothetical protein
MDASQEVELVAQASSLGFQVGWDWDVRLPPFKYTVIPIPTITLSRELRKVIGIFWDIPSFPPDPT